MTARCSRCHTNPQPKGRRYCNACHASYMRCWRKKQNDVVARAFDQLEISRETLAQVFTRFRVSRGRKLAA